MNRKRVIAGVGVLVALIVSATLGATADRMLASSDDEADTAPSEVIENVWVAESGYIVVNIAPDADPDHVAITDGPQVLSAQLAHPGKNTVILPPTREMRIKLNPLEGEGNAVSFPGAEVPDDHPETDVVVLRPGSYDITAIEDGETVDSMSFDLTLEATKNYIADRPLAHA